VLRMLVNFRISLYTLGDSDAILPCWRYSSRVTWPLLPTVLSGIIHQSENCKSTNNLGTQKKRSSDFRI